jgi:hypothetical protein
LRDVTQAEVIFLNPPTRTKTARFPEWLGAAASAITIFGAIIWLNSRDERAEDESARRIELISKARQILLNESSDGVFRFGADKLNDWAVRTLSKYGIAAEISAKEVHLGFADIECAELNIFTDKLFIMNSRLRDSSLWIDANSVAIEESYLSQVRIHAAHPARSKNLIDILSGLLDKVVIDMWLDVATQSVIDGTAKDFSHQVQLTNSVAREFGVETSSGMLQFGGVVAESLALVIVPDVCRELGKQGVLIDCAPLNTAEYEIDDIWDRALFQWKWKMRYNINEQSPCPVPRSIPDTR